MRTRKVIRYICDYCNKGFWKKSDAAEHEKKCFHNPETRSCLSCKHFYNRIVNIGFGDYDNMIKETYCDNYDKHLVCKRHLESEEYDEELEMGFRTKCVSWGLK